MTRKGSIASSPRRLSLHRSRGRRRASAPEGTRRLGEGGTGLRAARRQLGMTLVEVIVAATLALIGFLVALVLYSAARNLFKKGEQATDQQQEVRAAYDMMMKDLRLAGYNWNASGEDRPGEEQIEGAWSGAITVRGDFDFEDATKSTDPESVIAGTTNQATVGNDEIVTYCLRPATGTEATNAAFNADVNSTTTAASGGVNVAVRDGVTDTVTVAGVAIGQTQSNPPYNLYRVTLNNDSSTYGTGGASFQTWTLLAQNIKSLQFAYRDANGCQICGTPTSNPAGCATPPSDCSTFLGGAESTKSNRESIKKIDVTVVGMTAIADNNYTDTSDTTTSTQHYRKFSLTSQVTPRNLGFKGRADVDTLPPSTPTGLSICPGHCGSLVAKWNANPSNEGVATYTVKYGTSVSTMTNVQSTSSTNIYVSGLTEDTTYYFSVRATDAGGNSSSYSSSAGAAVGDLGPTVTTPSAPGGFTATGNPSPGGFVTLTWTPVTTNTSPLACDPVSTIRDLAGYRLYRSNSTPFTPSTSNQVLDETSLTGALGTYRDSTVVNCRPYYYNIKATDTTSCANLSTALGTPVSGTAVTTVAPAAPTGVNAIRTTASSANITWSAVNQDTTTPTPSTVAIDTYRIYRSQVANGADCEAATYANVGQSTPPAVSFSDTGAPAEQGGQKLCYKVTAVDDCPNESAKSTAAVMNCNFSGSMAVSVADSATGTAVNTSSMDPAPKRVTVTETGTDTYVSANLVIVKSGGSQDENNTLTSGSPWVFTWTPNQGAGIYTATLTVTNATGCTSSAVFTWTVTISSCNTCATITPQDPDPGSGTNKYYRQGNTVSNACSYDLLFTSIATRARSICTNGCTTPMKLLKLQYLPTCNGGTNANKSCSVTADCPGSTCNTTGFTNETSNLIYTAGGTGDNVSTTQTATVNFATPYLVLKANSTNSRFRWIYDTATPIWTGNGSTRQSVMEADVCFSQTSSLCSPSCITNIRLEP